MSYYHNAHPGFILYLALICISVLTFLYIDIQSVHLGILSIIWGGFILMRVLSLYEVSEHYAPLTLRDASKITNQGSSALPYDLSRRMSSHTQFKRGVLALHALDIRTILWFALGVIYLCAHLYIHKDTMSPLDIAKNVTIFFTIGTAFWAGQSYAASQSASHIMMVVFMALFALSLQKIGILLPENPPKFQDISLLNILLMTLMSYSAFVLLMGLRHGFKNVISIITGLMLILLLGLSYMQLDNLMQNTALWLSGWSLFSIFWIQSYSRRRKRYVLYQGQ